MSYNNCDAFFLCCIEFKHFFMIYRIKLLAKKHNFIIKVLCLVLYLENFYFYIVVLNVLCYLSIVCIQSLCRGSCRDTVANGGWIDIKVNNNNLVKLSDIAHSSLRE